MLKLLLYNCIKIEELHSDILCYVKSNKISQSLLIYKKKCLNVWLKINQSLHIMTKLFISPKSKYQEVYNFKPLCRIFRGEKCIISNSKWYNISSHRMIKVKWEWIDLLDIQWHIFHIFNYLLYKTLRTIFSEFGHFKFGVF